MLSLFISILLLAHLRVEGVTQTIAEEVEADHQEAEDDGRQPQQVGVEPQLRRPVAYQGTQRCLGHLDPEPYKAQERLREDCCWYREHEVYDDEPERVRDQMLPHKPEPACSQRARGEGELLIFQLQHPATHDPRHVRPAGQTYRDGDGYDPRIQDDHRKYGDHQVRDAVQDLDPALHDVVRPATREPRDSPVDDANEYVQQGSQETNVQRYSCTSPHPRPHVPSELVRAEPVLGGGTQVALGKVLTVGRMWRDQRSYDEGYGEYQDEDGEAYERPPVLLESDPGILPEANRRPCDTLAFVSIDVR